MKCRAIPYEGFEPYIFLSYCHRDANYVFPLAERLASAGFRVWYDDGNHAGDDWPESIAEHLENSHVCLTIVTKDFCQSHNCKSELNFTFDEGIKLVAIRNGSFTMPAGIRLQLSTTHYLLSEDYPTVDLLVQKLLQTDEIRECLSPVPLPMRSDIQVSEIPDNSTKVKDGSNLVDVLKWDQTLQEDADKQKVIQLADEQEVTQTADEQEVIQTADEQEVVQLADEQEPAQIANEENGQISEIKSPLQQIGSPDPESENWVPVIGENAIHVGGRNPEDRPTPRRPAKRPDSEIGDLIHRGRTPQNRKPEPEKETAQASAPETEPILEKKSPLQQIGSPDPESENWVPVIGENVVHVGGRNPEDRPTPRRPAKRPDSEIGDLIHRGRTPQNRKPEPEKETAQASAPETEPILEKKSPLQQIGSPDPESENWVPVIGENAIHVGGRNPEDRPNPRRPAKRPDSEIGDLIHRGRRSQEPEREEAAPAHIPGKKSRASSRMPSPPAEFPACHGSSPFSMLGEKKARTESAILLIHVETNMVHTFSRPSVLIGRTGNRCDLVIQDDPTVSSIHARIFSTGTDISIQDQQSTNGTFLHGKRLENGAREPLTTGAVIRIGTQHFVFADAGFTQKLPDRRMVLLINQKRTAARFLSGNVLQLNRSKENVWIDGTLREPSVHRGSHALVVRRADGIYLTEAAPAHGNPTKLNGHRLSPQQSCCIHSGDQITVGSTPLDVLILDL